MTSATGQIREFLHDRILSNQIHTSYWANPLIAGVSFVMSGRIGTKGRWTHGGESEQWRMSPQFVHFQANLEGSLLGKTKTWGSARKLDRKGSKRQNIAELVGHNESGGEMVRKVEFKTVQGSDPIISVRCNRNSEGVRFNSRDQQTSASDYGVSYTFPSHFFQGPYLFRCGVKSNFLNYIFDVTFLASVILPFGYFNLDLNFSQLHTLGFWHHTFDH